MVIPPKNQITITKNKIKCLGGIKKVARLKQVILVRTDIKMGKGKLAAQVAHASIQCFYITLSKKPGIAHQWIKEGQKKVVLKVPDYRSALDRYEKAVRNGIIACIVYDAGHTQLEPGTLTTVGIGPDKEELIDYITGDLKLM